MRAAVLRNGSMVYRDDVPEPVPREGQVLVRVLACGICGGDLHFAVADRDRPSLGRCTLPAVPLSPSTAAMPG